MFSTRPVSPLRIGIDLGGTKIEAVALLFRENRFEIVERVRVPTPQAEGYDAIVDATAGLIAATVRSQKAEAKSVPIGVGMPGGTTRRGGLVKNSNTTCLNGRPFRQDLQARRGRELVFDNDANCFALAEAEMGAGRGHRDGVVFGVIMGTGVGGGVAIAGRTWPGAQGIAGEWGHHAVYAVPDGSASGLRSCYCGQQGCVETWLSGPAIEADYERESGRRLPLKKIVDQESTDDAARRCLDRMLGAFGRALANVIDILDPSIVVLGGGVSNIDALYSRGVERVRSYVFNDELLTPIVRHELGDSAGVIGAALIA